LLDGRRPDDEDGLVSDLLSPAELPTGFAYPRLLLRVVERGLVGLEPWWVLCGDRLRRRMTGLRERYPQRVLVPFAARQDDDDVACWDGTSPEVLIIHDFASPGWELSARYAHFEDWFRQAVADFIDWD
jgi:hypothetical protein